MADLVSTLTSMGIQPIGQADTAYRYTEHRTIQVAAMPSFAAGGADAPAQTVQVGDKVVLSLDKEEGHHRLVTLSPYEDDLDDGIVSIHGPTGKEMLGKSVEDEVELPWKGEIRHATILGLEKMPSPSIGEDGQPPSDTGSESSKEEPQEARPNTSDRDSDRRAEGPKSTPTKSGNERKTKLREKASPPANTGQHRLFEDEPAEAVAGGNPAEGESPSPSVVNAETNKGGLDEETRAICQMT